MTGGLGFMGSNLVHALVDAGAEVTVIDSLVPRHGGDLRNVEAAAPEIIVDDIANATAHRELLVGADYVFNLAGQVSHTDSMRDPVTDLDINARSQLAFLEAMNRLGGTATVVYASTRQVYGRPHYLPVDERHPVNPVDVNGVSKLAAERLHLLYGETYGLPVSVLRLSNVYGPRQRLEGNHQGFIPVFIRRALEGVPIEIYGDGAQERDSLYVDDAVRALQAAALSPLALGETFNIGHPEYLSLNDIAKELLDLVGDGEILHRPWPNGEERISIGTYRTDIQKARTMLDWEPVVSLRDGLQRTLASIGAAHDTTAETL